MTKINAVIQRHALNVTLLLMALAIGTSVYALFQVQDQRKATILRECNQENTRHAVTVRQFDLILAESLKQHPSRREQIEESRQPTILLINALAPYQNCQRVLAKST